MGVIDYVNKGRIARKRYDNSTIRLIANIFHG